MSSLRLIIALHTAAEDLLNEPDLVGSPAWFPTVYRIRGSRVMDGELCTSLILQMSLKERMKNHEAARNDSTVLELPEAAGQHLHALHRETIEEVG